MQEEHLKGLSILIIDDQASNILLLRSMLERAGYTNLHGSSDPGAIKRWMTQAQPDLIMLDLHMPVRNGFAVMDDIQAMAAQDEYLPILVITADATQETRRNALARGARDFLSKPFDQTEVLLRIHNLLETRAFHLWLRSHNKDLEKLVLERTIEIETAHQDTLERLARAAEYRDDATGEHIKRVGHLSMLLAGTLGQPHDFIELIMRAAPLHDVGKIGIPDHILLKPGALTPEEFSVVKTHTSIGAQILAGSEDLLLNLAEEIALNHHERWDGTGYPNGVAGTDIPLAGRIVAVADVYDALTHERPYKGAWTVEQAIEEISQQSGQQFDPRIVDGFLHLSQRSDDPLGSLKADFQSTER